MTTAVTARVVEHEHGLIGQIWILEGHLVDKSAPDEGQFIWRPAGCRPSISFLDGGLFLTIFPNPNKLLSATGHFTDMAGVDWNSIWGPKNVDRVSRSPNASAWRPAGPAH
jgi:hypothetical protein